MNTPRKLSQYPFSDGSSNPYSVPSTPPRLGAYESFSAPPIAERYVAKLDPLARVQTPTNAPPTPAETPRSRNQPTSPLLTPSAFPKGSFLGPYQIVKTIGEGSYGKVKLAVNTRSHEKVAIKIINKASLKKDSHVVRLRREIRLLRLFDHPNIIKMHWAEETQSHILMAMEYVEGGELLDHLQSRPGNRLDEAEARYFFAQLISAISYLHNYHIIHRDLKPQNVLLEAKTRTLKLIDFGFSNFYELEDRDDSLYMMKTFCGSPFYASPEMVSGTPYQGPEIDVWSLGVILYSSLVGHVPFNDEHVKGLYDKILHGKMQPIPDHVSAEAKHLILGLLTVEPARRTTLSQVFRHPWLHAANQSMRPSTPSSIERHILVHMMGFYFPGTSFEPRELAQAIMARTPGTLRYGALYRLLERSKAQIPADRKSSLADYPKMIAEELQAKFSKIPSPPPLVAQKGAAFILPDRILEEAETVVLASASEAPSHPWHHLFRKWTYAE